ncbi:MAG: hypothetical protein K9K36_13685 [Desulfarculaceae bacterium]|nr:hypothetical protein [Desulfarculaceae bacterium]MCF8047627.1 hypothetical protein [Desulfarculaceae bacterium]MCF8066295.1 hypothetical protein [Desulfarculaceae bacterium]MCF8121398.1 hypothetical protein [Desulfarculaceae bacterium]
MHKSLIAYNLALGLAGTSLPGLWLGSRLARSWGEFWPRLGLYRDLPPAGNGPRVWLQAVSVGEVAVAMAVAEELWARRPEIELSISSSTAKGLERAAELFAGRAKVLPFPLEAPWAVAGAWQKVRPQVYASLETELWPNFLAWLDNRGCDLLLLNGRISPRSFPRYMKARPFVAGCLERFSLLSMIGPEDAKRAKALGAPPERVRVEGNAKYAGLAQRVAALDPEHLAQRLALGGAPLLVAGSVRTGEEQVVLGAFKQVLQGHPEAVLAVAPRHVEKSPRWLAAARDLGLSAQAWGELSPTQPRRGDTRVVVVDAMGRLLTLYGLAAAAFVGASLVPLGGQNPMEPAAWGVPVAYGPDMADFLDAAQALELAGASRMTINAEELAAWWEQMLFSPERAAQMGQAARTVVAGWSGAAQAAAGHILGALKRQGV